MGKLLIRACVRCASTALDFTPGDGSAILTKVGIGPIGGVALCKGCGQLGIPIEFDSEEAYLAFASRQRKGLKKSGEKPTHKKKPGRER